MQMEEQKGKRQMPNIKVSIYVEVERRAQNVYDKVEKRLLEQKRELHELMRPETDKRLCKNYIGLGHRPLRK